MFGKSEQEKERELRRRENEKQRRHSLQQAALQQAQADDRGGEVLRQLSEINDLPDFPGRTLDQFVSKIVSTSNLSEEDITSDEWVKEYVLLLYRSQFPPDYGLTGHARAYAFGEKSEKRDPFDEERQVEAEMFKHSSGLALTRSEDMAATKEATRTIAETLARDETSEESSGGGLLGRLRGD